MARNGTRESSGAGGRARAADRTAYQHAAAHAERRPAGRHAATGGMTSFGAARGSAGAAQIEREHAVRGRLPAGNP